MEDTALLDDPRDGSGSDRVNSAFPLRDSSMLPGTPESFAGIVIVNVDAPTSITIDESDQG